MMQRYMVTQSLLSSWLYMYSCREEQQDSAREDFLKTLNREPKEQTEAMLKGIEFENEVYAAAAGTKRAKHPKWEAGIMTVATILRGAPVQVKVQQELDIGDTPVLLYGVLDALKAGTIYDVKFITRSFHSADLAGRYLNSVQHPTYFALVPEAVNFTYLTSDGYDVYSETYTREQTKPIEPVIAEFFDYLRTIGQFDTYKEKWLAK